MSLGYSLKGQFLDACDCEVICSCAVGVDPTVGACTGLYAWQISSGTIGDVAVDGLSAVTISTHTGDGDAAGHRVLVIIDDRGSESQQEQLRLAFSGALGGPLGDLLPTLGTLLGVESARIDVRHTRAGSTISIDGRAEVAMRLLVDEASGRSPRLLGSSLPLGKPGPVAVGQGDRFAITVPQHGIAADISNRSANRGRFTYLHAPSE
jgi:hypothetical protein